MNLHREAIRPKFLRKPIATCDFPGVGGGGGGGCLEPQSPPPESAHEK